jgi:hypothetical protein
LFYFRGIRKKSSLVRSDRVPAFRLLAARVPRLLLALVAVDAERLRVVQLVTSRTNAFEAAMGVLTSSRSWAQSLKLYYLKKIRLLEGS